MGEAARMRISEHVPEERLYPFFVRISSPWDDAQYVMAECPEHFNSDGGWILNHRRDIVLVHQMLQPVAWEFSDDGTQAGYAYAAEDGMRLSVQLRAQDDEVRVTTEFTNGSPTAVNLLEPCFCLRLDAMGELTTPEDKADHLNRTFVIIGGRPVPMAEVSEGVAEAHRAANPKRHWTGCTVRGERREPEYWWLSPSHVADCGLIATESPAGGRWIAFAWERTRLLFTNTQCPCVHAQPVFDDCPPRRTVRAEGRIVFFEGTLDQLIRQRSL